MSRIPPRWFALAMMLVIVCASCGGTEGAHSFGTTPDGSVVPIPDDNVDAGDRTTTTTAPPLRHFTIAASGDILLHNLVIVDGRTNAGRHRTAVTCAAAVGANGPAQCRAAAA